MPAPASNLKLLAINIVVAVLYACLGGFTAFVSSELRSVIFASAGVWLGFGVVYGFKATALGIVLGQLTLSPWFNHSLPAGLLIAVFNLIACWLGVHLYHRWRLSFNFNTVRDVLLFSALVLLILQPLISTGSLLSLYALGRLPLDDLPIRWMNWWISNGVGQLLFAPLFIVWLTPQNTKNPLQSPLELLNGLLSLTLVIALAFFKTPVAQFLANPT